MPWLWSGIVLFSSGVGYFVGTHNAQQLDKGLFAIAVALGALFALVQKFYGLREAANAPVQRTDAAITTLPTPLASFALEQARTLGQTLIAISVGFTLGYVGGTYIRLYHQEWLRATPAVPVPWKNAPTEGRSIETLAGYVALAERLKALGWRDEKIVEIYSGVPVEGATASELKAVGKAWLTRPAPLQPPACSPSDKNTKNDPSTLATPPLASQ
jgi:hypothetical protein